MQAKHVLRSLLAFLVLVVPSLAGPAPALAYDSCALDPSNLLLNGSMATSPNGVSANWSSFVLQGNPVFEWSQLHGNEGWDPNGSQYIYSDSMTFDAGILQNVGNLTPGQEYHFWMVWGQAIVDPGGGQNYTTQLIDRQLGVDPTGGTNAQAPSVMWTVPYNGTDGFNRPEWHLYFIAPGPTATFFLRAVNTGTSGRYKVFFDTACLFPSSEPTTTPWAPVLPAHAPAPSETPRPKIAAAAVQPTKTAVPPTDTPTPTATLTPTPTLTPTVTNTPTETPKPRRAIPVVQNSAGETGSGPDLVSLAALSGSIALTVFSLVAIVALGLFIWLKFRRPAPLARYPTPPPPPRGQPRNPGRLRAE